MTLPLRTAIVVVLALLRPVATARRGLDRDLRNLRLLAAVRRARRALALEREEVARLTLRVHRVQAAWTSNFQSAWTPRCGF